MSSGVVVSGMAIWSPYGRGLPSFWNGLLSNKSALSPICRFSVDSPIYRTKEAASIVALDKNPLGPGDGISELVETVTLDLLFDALLDNKTDISPYDIGVMVGSSQSTSSAFDEYVRFRLGQSSTLKTQSPNQWISSCNILPHISALVGAKGPAMMISTACASATSAIGVGYDLIRSGRIRRAVVGGVGFYTDISFSGFNILRLTAKHGCRPFDRDRDGMTLADGIGLLVLEEEGLALARQAKIWGRITGYSCGNEAYHATSPDPSGWPQMNVMWNALGRSRDRLNNLGYINAHGTGTVANDKAELLGIQSLLKNRQNDQKVKVSSTKGHHGHALGAAGSIELIATILAMKSSTVPINLGLSNGETGFNDLDLVIDSPVVSKIQLAISNSFAFGGNIACIAVENA